MKERAASDVLLVMLSKAMLDVSEACPDAVLMSFQGGQVDGVGEVRRE